MCRSGTQATAVQDFANALEHHCETNSHRYAYPGDRYRSYAAVAAPSTCDPTTKNSAESYEPVTPFQTVTVPEVSLYSMCQLVAHYACIGDEVLLSTLALMCRYEVASRIPITAHMMHRLFAACVQAASKFHCDLFADNLRMASVIGVQLVEMNSLELELLKAIDWRLYVPSEEFQAITEDPRGAPRWLTQGGPQPCGAPCQSSRKRCWTGFTLPPMPAPDVSPRSANSVAAQSELDDEFALSQCSAGDMSVSSCDLGQ